MARPAQPAYDASIQHAEKLPFQEVQRARIVLYASEGMADTEIAGRLDTTAGIVGKW
jgi:transposase